MTARSLMMEVHKTERNASEQTRGIKDKYTWRRRAIRKWDRDRQSSDRALREALRQADVCQKKNSKRSKFPRANRRILGGARASGFLKSNRSCGNSSDPLRRVFTYRSGWMAGHETRNRLKKNATGKTTSSGCPSLCSP
jgi:hypothetical protein